MTEKTPTAMTNPHNAQVDEPLIKGRDMTRYTVWHETARHDGDRAFDTLVAARAEFDHQCTRPNVVRVELQDNTNPDDPLVLEEYDVRRTHKGPDR